MLPQTEPPDYVRGSRAERLLFYVFMGLMVAGLLAILLFALAG